MVKVIVNPTWQLMQYLKITKVNGTNRDRRISEVTM